MRLHDGDEFVVKVGCDAQATNDVLASLSSFGEAYVRHLLSVEEQKTAPNLDHLEAAARHIAGRFAAKEAVFKLLGAGPDDGIAWPQIEVLTDPHGAPSVRLNSAAAALASKSGIEAVAVSISHTERFAFAVAAAVATHTSGGASPE